MQLTVNGEPVQLSDGATVAALLDRLEVRAARVAVEVNRVVVRREQHATYRLADGDRVEVVTFVGGG
jgi:sulfur carrier protein